MRVRLSLTSYQSGEQFIPRMVRIGGEASVNPTVKEILLENLCSDAIDKDNMLKKEQQEFEGFRASTHSSTRYESALTQTCSTGLL